MPQPAEKKSNDKAENVDVLRAGFVESDSFDSSIRGEIGFHLDSRSVLVPQRSQCTDMLQNMEEKRLVFA